MVYITRVYIDLLLLFVNSPHTHHQYQERETTVNLLVGARYGISQVVNHKLNLLSPLMEFSSIGRVELMPESEKISVVRIYIQDMKVKWSHSAVHLQ